MELSSFVRCVTATVAQVCWHVEKDGYQLKRGFDRLHDERSARAFLLSGGLVGVGAGPGKSRAMRTQVRTRL